MNNRQQIPWNLGEFPFFRRADNFQYFHCCSRWLRAWHLFNNFPLPRLPLEHIRAAIKQPLQFLPNFLQFGIFRQILPTCGLRKDLGLRDGVQKTVFWGNFLILVDPPPLAIIGLFYHTVQYCVKTKYWLQMGWIWPICLRETWQWLWMTFKGSVRPSGL